MTTLDGEAVAQLDADEIRRRTRQLTSEVNQRSDEVAAARRLPADLVVALKSAGAFRMSMPESWGGPAMPFPDQLGLVEDLAYADPSVGWCVMIGSDSGLISAWFDDAVAREMWIELDDVTAGWLTPAGTATSVADGYRVAGRWKFGSGCTHADVMMAGCIVVDASGKPLADDDGRPVVRTIVARASCFEIVDTWHTTGLAGSGSNDFTCGDLFVPAEQTFSLFDMPRREGPLHAIRGGLLVNMPAVPLGLARRAIDEAVAIVSDKFSMPDGAPMRQIARVREAVADAQRAHRAAHAYVDAAVERAWTALVAGRPLDTDERIDLVLSRIDAFRMALDVAQAMVRLVGTQAIYSSCVLDRLLRDAITMNQHIVTGAPLVDSAGRLALGIDLEGFAAALV